MAGESIRQTGNRSDGMAYRFTASIVNRKSKIVNHFILPFLPALAQK